MKNLRIRSGRGLVVAGCVLLVSNAVLACGDKLMVVARGQRAGVGKNAPHRGAIILYAAPGSAVSKALDGAELKKGLERAGHRVRTVTTRTDLQSAIGSGSYDLVLADVHAVGEVEGSFKGTANSPTVIPTLFDPTPQDLASASSALHCVVQSKGSKDDYLSVVNDALTQRAKARSPAKASRKS